MISPNVCSICGQAVVGLRQGRCLACYQYWRRHGVERIRPITSLCSECGQLLPDTYWARRYCSGRCRVRAWRARQRTAAGNGGRSDA
jgi:hypothetical protein